jgi:hypothetical protein
VALRYADAMAWNGWCKGALGMVVLWHINGGLDM